MCAATPRRATRRPKSKHWVLLANYNDQSMMRNKLAADFANDIGSLGMKSTWVECVLNGDWQGTYQFGEQIRVAKERVNVHDWEGDAGDIAEAFVKAQKTAGHILTGDQEDELATQLEQNFTWVTTDTFSYLDKTNNVTLTGQPSVLLKKFTNDISGGYLFEFSEEYDEVSKFTTSSGVLGVKTMMKSPEYLYTNTDMFNYCQDYLKKYWDCDYESMVNYWLVMEMFGNNDAVKKSRYAYKEQGQKLVFGPVWDFDWGVGSLRVSSNGTGWKCQEADGKTAYSFFKDWADSPEFCTRLHTRYWQVRNRFAACMADGGLIDQYTNFIYEAQRLERLQLQRVREGRRPPQELSHAAPRLARPAVCGRAHAHGEREAKHIQSPVHGRRDDAACGIRESQRHAAKGTAAAYALYRWRIDCDDCLVLRERHSRGSETVA